MGGVSNMRCPVFAKGGATCQLVRTRASRTQQHCVALLTDYLMRLASLTSIAAAVVSCPTLCYNVSSLTAQPQVLVLYAWLSTSMTDFLAAEVVTAHSSADHTLDRTFDL